MSSKHSEGRSICWDGYNFDILLNIQQKKILTSAENIRTGVSKLHSPCPEEHLDGNRFFEKFISLTRKFALWAKKIGFQQEDWNRVVRTSFFMSRKTVQKNLFAGKDYNFLQFFRPLSARKEWLLPWIVGMSAGTEFSQSAGKNWPKSYFFEKKLNFSSSMWTFKFKYSFFGFQTSAGLSKVQVTCPLKLVFQRCSFFFKKS